MSPGVADMDLGRIAQRLMDLSRDLDQKTTDAEIAEAKLRACRARIATIKVQIDTGRSLGTAIRADMAFAGSGVTP